MSPLDLVNLTPLMELTSGRSEVAIGMVDGPVAVSHPDFARRKYPRGAGEVPHGVFPDGQRGLQARDLRGEHTDREEGLPGPRQFALAAPCWYDPSSPSRRGQVSRSPARLLRSSRRRSSRVSGQGPAC